MSLWELDRNFDTYFSTWSEQELELILNEVEKNKVVAEKHIETIKERISELKDLLKSENSELEDVKADLIVMEKMKDSALIRIDNI